MKENSGGASDNRKTYRLLLISPRQKYVGYTAQVELAKIFNKKRMMTTLALPTVAALTPSNYEIKIIDEEIEPIPESYKPDIVGITTISATATRAYELGDLYRMQGAKVVLGGPLASYRVEESLEHADSIVVGEAEINWENCLKDFEAGNLKPTYENVNKCEFKTPPVPRWDLVSTDKIFQVAVQASRGCPFNCDFCLVSALFGRKMRHRDVENVVAEIKALPSKWVFFVDDNFTINKNYSRKLLEAIKPLGISWTCQSSIDVAEDEELLQLMADSGCFNILIGFESLNPESLEETNKMHNKGAENFKQAVATIHKYGINTIASFVVGFDSDTLDEFDNIHHFTLEAGLVNVNIHTLSAVPGTQLYEKMKAEKKLADLSLDLGVGFLPNQNYKNFSRIELFEKYMESIERIYSWETLNKKAEILFGKGTFIKPGADISFWLKLKMTGILVVEYILSRNKQKKALYKTIMKLKAKKLVSMDKGFGFLMYMLGINRHLKMHQRMMEEYRSIIR